METTKKRICVSPGGKRVFQRRVVGGKQVFQRPIDDSWRRVEGCFTGVLRVKREGFPLYNNKECAFHGKARNGVFRGVVKREVFPVYTTKKVFHRVFPRS